MRSWMLVSPPCILRCHAPHLFRIWGLQSVPGSSFDPHGSILSARCQLVLEEWTRNKIQSLLFSESGSLCPRQCFHVLQSMAVGSSSQTSPWARLDALPELMYLSLKLHRCAWSPSPDPSSSSLHQTSSALPVLPDWLFHLVEEFQSAQSLAEALFPSTLSFPEVSTHSSVSMQLQLDSGTLLSLVVEICANVEVLPCLSSAHSPVLGGPVRFPIISAGVFPHEVWLGLEGILCMSCTHIGYG